MPSYDLDYALRCLRDAIDYAEQTGDFVAARKWVNEVEESAYDDIIAKTKGVSAMAIVYKITKRVQAWNQYGTTDWGLTPASLVNVPLTFELTAEGEIRIVDGDKVRVINPPWPDNNKAFCLLWADIVTEENGGTTPPPPSTTFPFKSIIFEADDGTQYPYVPKN